MKIERLISIILLLLDQGRISAQKLAEMYEVSLRTIYRDLDTIDRAGIPIRSTSGVGGGFEIMPNYKLDRTVFSTADLSAILLGLANLSDMIHDDDLINALVKIKSLIPADKAKEIELKTNQIQIDLSSWLGKRDVQHFLELIKTALQENKLLAFDYIDRHGHKTTRIAEPYQLVLKSSHWYWQGYCLKRKDFRLFRLSRISQLKIQPNHFVPRAYPKPLLEFDDILETLQTNIIIRIHKSVMDRVLDFCSYANFSPDGDEHYLVNFPFIENNFYYNLLFSFGNQCECLEPLHIRKEMQRRIHELVRIYDN